MYRFLANLIVFIHILFMFMFLIAVVVSIQGRLDEYNVLQIFFWVWISAKIIFYLIFKGCILTKFEQNLRRMSGQGIYTEGFIKHYLDNIGISVNDKTVIWLVVTPVVVAVVSELYRFFV